MKKPVEEKLLREAAKLPARFRTAPDACYRKRFPYKGDMESLIMFGGLDDGVASWTSTRAYAKDFKGLTSKYSPPLSRALLSMGLRYAGCEANLPR